MARRPTPTVPDIPPDQIDPRIIAATRTRVLPLSAIRRQPGNPRRGDVEFIKAGIARFGQRFPRVIRTAPDGALEFLAGSHLHQALEELGWTQIVVVDADDLTADEQVAFSLFDNRASDRGGYDEDDLAAMLAGLDTDTQALVGWGPDDLADLMATTTDEDGDTPRPFYEKMDGDPTQFDSVDTDHECPKCHYRW